MGRVFDAVASLLGVTDISSFEGEAAMMVSELALNYLKKNPQLPTAWLRDNELQNNLNPKLIIDQIINAVNQGTDKSEIAAWFHVRLALMIKKVANENHCNKVCCSGGVFQNEVLIDLLAAISGENITLYYNKDLPPNDENISFGQLAWFIMYQKNFSSSAL